MLDKLRKQADELKSVDAAKYSMISDILKYDYCFFEMSMAEAYQILADLGIQQEDIRRVYLKLLKWENYN